MTRILLLLLATSFCAQASYIEPSSINQATVYSGYSYWAAPCNGFELGVIPWGCITGEIRYFSDLGEVLTGYLRPTVLLEESIPVIPPITVIPESPPPVMPPIIEATATPEPKLMWLLIIVLLLGVCRILGRKKDSNEDKENGAL